MVNEIVGLRGTNKPRPFEKGDGGTLQVQSIFYTVQGEGPFAGRSAIFIRLTGCHYRCFWCDTSWDDDNDDVLTVDTIIHRVHKVTKGHQHQPRLVVLTGGEPTRQPIDKLVYALTAREYEVQIETAGSFWRECMASPGVFTVVSPKTSKINEKVERYAMAWKYVVSYDDIHPLNGLPCSGTQRPKGMHSGEGKERPVFFTGGMPARPPETLAPGNVFLSPCDIPEDPERTKKNTQAVAEMAMRYGYTAGLQMHKYFDVP